MIFKEDLVRRIARATHLSQPVVLKVLDSYVAHIQQALLTGQTVQHTNFGTFYSRLRLESTLRDFQTGKPARVPARTVAAFRVGELLKHSLARLKPATKGSTQGGPRKR